jgi:hypothetical protein
MEILSLLDAIDSKTSIDNNAVIVVGCIDGYTKILECDNLNKKLNILVSITHEYMSSSTREYLIRISNPLHKIFFLTTHLDSKTIDNDLSFKTKAFPFKDLFLEKFYTIDYLRNAVNKKRNKKLNFFNRTANLRRIKAFEIFKKKEIDLSDSYNTFGFIMMDNTFGGIRTIGEYINRISKFSNVKDNYSIDIEYVESKQNEYFTYENREWHCSDPKQSGEKYVYEIINDLTLDSYASFVIESSNDTFDDLRFTEKTLRAMLFKTIPLFLGVAGYNKALREHGIETFEDVFGLDIDWDECGETERVERFINTLDTFNKLSKDEMERIYFSDGVQAKLNSNFELMVESFEDKNLFIKELLNKIGYENNVFK